MKLIEDLQLISEMIVHGKKRGITDVVAYRKDIWLIQDKEDIDDIEIPGVDTIGIEDVYELVDEIRDSGRNDVFIGRIEGDTLIQHDSGTFKFDPKSSILIKKLAKQLKVKYVDYYDMSDNVYTTTRRSFKGKIRSKAYHGTSTKYLGNIIRLGLAPGKRETNYPGISHPKFIFFTSRFDEAWMHAVHTANKTKSEPVVIELKIPDKDKLIPDYDIDVNSENKFYKHIKTTTRDKARKHIQPMRGKAMGLSREFGIYGYRGRIPPKFFVSYHLILNPEENGIDINYASNDHIEELDKEEAKIYLDTKDEFGYGYTEYPEFEDEEDEY